MLLTKKYDIYSQTIGRVTSDSKLIINDLININKKELKEYYYNSFGKMMDNKSV